MKSTEEMDVLEEGFDEIDPDEDTLLEEDPDYDGEDKEESYDDFYEDED